MTESRGHETSDPQIVAVRFRMKASADEVVARLLEAVRRTDLSLLHVVGDGSRVYPFGGRSPAQNASSWRAELLWRSASFRPGWQLEVFLRRAELFLELPGGVRLVGGGQRSPRKGGRERRHARSFGRVDEVRDPLGHKT